MPEGEVRRYAGRGADVTWDRRRCLHVGACVRGLPEVFDPSARPWIRPDAATPDALADLVRRCPTGALGLVRRDGGPPEPTPTRNEVVVVADGPLHVQGDVAVLGPDGAVRLEAHRVALCRCGASGNRPLCDGSHARAAFTDPGRVTAPPRAAAPAPEPHGRLEVRPAPDGPLLLGGTFDVVGTEGRLGFRAGRGALCRCGASANRPLCDGSHRKAGFRAP